MVSIVDVFWVATTTIADPFNFALLVLGVLFGMFVGLLPGLGGIVVLALLIPLTFQLDPQVAFMVLTAATGGTTFSGSITAILLNTPGTAPNAATLIDGYPMTRQGRAGEAIGISATASALGALVGVVVLAASVPIMLEVVLLFGPQEIFWLGLWGITALAVIIRGNSLAGLVSGIIGLLLSMHGSNYQTANVRWDYGITEMQSGIPLIPALVGLFAIGEMIKLISEGEGVVISDSEGPGKLTGKWTGVKQVFVHKWLFLRSALLGTVIGAIPGLGSMAATYLAYGQAAMVKDNENFGKGDSRGVIAPEAANDAKDGGGFIPTLALGVPGSASMAVLFGAFVLHGITPGPLLVQENLDIVFIIILSLLISNILTSVIGLLLAEYIARVAMINVFIIAPVIIVITFASTFAASGNYFNVFLTLLFGIAGFVMMTVDISRIPLILGLILGPIIEKNYFQALQISGGNLATFVDSPVAIILVLLFVGSLLLPLWRGWRQKN